MASVSESRPIRQNDNSRCRICMFPKQNLSSLFRRGGLSMKIMKLAEIKMYEGDGLPPTICLDCEVEVNRCVNFIGHIQRADAKLREMLVNGTESIEVFERVEESEEREQEATTSQIDIEEFNVKQEMILDNLLEEKTDAISESDYHHFDTPLENNVQPEEEAELNPLDHVDVVEDRNRSDAMEVPVDPFGQEEPLIESQKSESDPTADPLICMKQEAVSMDVDKNSPQPCGSSSMDNGSLTLGVNTTPDVRCERSIFKTQVIEGNNVFHTQIGQQTDFTTLMAQNVLPQSSVILIHDNFLNMGPTKNLGFCKNVISLASVAENYNFDMNDEISLSSLKGRPTSMPASKKDFSLKQAKKEVNFENSFSCFVCNVIFNSAELLLEHKTEDKFICRVCTKEFISHVELETHALGHKIYTCPVCSQQFICKGDLLKHKQMHNITKYQCEFCNKTFSKFICLTKHKAGVHESNVNKHKCIVCGKGFLGLPLLKDHQKKLHVTYERIKCNMCPRVYLGPDALKVHIKSKHLYSEENAPVSCTICGKVLASSKGLSEHLETHNTAEIVCEICGKIAKNKNSLRQHITLYHSTKIKQLCKICNEQFDDLKMYRKHKRNHKTRNYIQNPAICEICGKRFKTSYILKNHMVVHSNDRPLTCEVCGASFKFPVSLRNHRKVHNTIGEYNCKLCDKSFKWKPTFDKHLTKCEALERMY